MKGLERPRAKDDKRIEEPAAPDTHQEKEPIRGVLRDMVERTGKLSRAFVVMAAALGPVTDAAKAQGDDSFRTRLEQLDTQIQELNKLGEKGARALRGDAGQKTGFGEVEKGQSALEFKKFTLEEVRDAVSMHEGDQASRLFGVENLQTHILKLTQRIDALLLERDKDESIDYWASKEGELKKETRIDVLKGLRRISGAYGPGARLSEILDSATRDWKTNVTEAVTATNNVSRVLSALNVLEDLYSQQVGGRMLSSDELRKLEVAEKLVRYSERTDR